MPEPSPQPPPSRPRSAALVGLRAAVGLATPEEVRVLTESPRIVGGGLIVYAPLTFEQWAERFGGPRAPA